MEKIKQWFFKVKIFFKDNKKAIILLFIFILLLILTLIASKKELSSEKMEPHASEAMAPFAEGVSLDNDIRSDKPTIFDFYIQLNLSKEREFYSVEYSAPQYSRVDFYNIVFTSEIVEGYNYYVYSYETSNGDFFPFLAFNNEEFTSNLSFGLLNFNFLTYEEVTYDEFNSMVQNFIFEGGSEGLLVIPLLYNFGAYEKTYINDLLNEIDDLKNKLDNSSTMFFGIADLPIEIVKNLFNVEIMGVNLLKILIPLLFIGLVWAIIKIFKR